MARTLHAPHLSTDPTPLATALYLGLCLLAVALMATAADLLDAPYRSDTVLRAPNLRLHAEPRLPVDARGAELAPAQPALPVPRLQSQAAPASSRTAPGEGGGLLLALRALAAEGRLPSPSNLDAPEQGGAGLHEALADAGPVALPGEADGINVRRGGDGAGAQRLGELVTAGVQDVSYGPKPTPAVELDDASGDGLAALAPAAAAGTAALLTAG